MDAISFSEFRGFGEAVRESRAREQRNEPTQNDFGRELGEQLANEPIPAAVPRPVRERPAQPAGDTESAATPGPEAQSAGDTPLVGTDDRSPAQGTVAETAATSESSAAANGDNPNTDAATLGLLVAAMPAASKAPTQTAQIAITTNAAPIAADKAALCGEQHPAGGLPAQPKAQPNLATDPEAPVDSAEQASGRVLVDAGKNNDGEARGLKVRVSRAAASGPMLGAPSLGGAAVGIQAAAVSPIIETLPTTTPIETRGAAVAGIEAAAATVAKHAIDEAVAPKPATDFAARADAPPSIAANPAAPTAPAAAPSTQSVRIASLVLPAHEQVALQVVRAVRDSIDHIRIQMDPADLGRVDVRIEVAHDGKVIAVMAAERQETLDLLQRDSRALERALHEAGLKTGNDSLSFSLRQQQGEQRHAQADTASPDRDGQRFDLAGGNDNTPAPMRARALLERGIDISV